MKLNYFLCFLFSSFVQLSLCEISPEFYLKSIYQLGLENPDLARLESARDGYIREFKLRKDHMQRSEYDLPYYKIFPKFLAAVPPGTVLEFDNLTCWHNLKLSTSRIHMDQIELTIEHKQGESLLCHRSFVISTGAHTQVVELIGNGVKTISLTSDGSPEQDWDLLERGPRVFVHLMTPEQLTYNIGATLALFQAELNPGSTTSDDMNREFLKSFVGIDMPLRNNAPDVLDLPEEVFKNGDTIDILRLNGLSPCIAWAMGAATGHTAVALWRADRLYICESTSKSSDWSINGIQCNPYPAWIEMARNAISYHAVFAPLDRTNGEELLDMDKVWQFVDKHVGLDYGFEVVLMGWLDTVRDNLPCPKDRDQDYCLEPEHFEMLFHFVEKVSLEAARVFVPAVQIRAEVPFDTTLLYAYYTAALKGIDPIEIYSIPEQEGWLYWTTRDGNPVIAESMVCNDFVCNVWEEGGLFNGTNVNCAETSVNDNYKLNIYQDPELRHQLCKDQDPENPNCQLLGKYSLRLDSQPGVLPRYNYVPPTDEMFGACPSMAPDYLAPQDC